MSDPLRDVLELASREGALQGEGLEAFAEALRERADLVLAERVKPLEDRIRALEDGVRALEAEVSWRREELDRTRDAHVALLAHHRDVVGRVASEILSVAALSPLRVREARRRLRALAGLLRVDSR